MAKFVYTTDNPGKLSEVRARFAHLGFDLFGRKEAGLGGTDAPEENGTTLGENARAKVEYYAELARARRVAQEEPLVLLADDTGLEIDGLGGEPGVHVRRWKDGTTRMTDDEIVSYALARMSALSGDARKASFRTILAAQVVQPDGSISPVSTFEGFLRGHIVKIPAKPRIEGFPFASLFYIPVWQMMLCELEQTPPEKRPGRMSHRERAIECARPWLQTQQ